MKRLPWPWSAWSGARTASLHRQWDCCPKLFTLKIVALCVWRGGLRCIPNMMHTCFKSHHEKNQFLSITAATTNVR